MSTTKQPVTCPTCGDVCASKNKLRRHVRRFHVEGGRGIKTYEHENTVPGRSYVAARDYYDTVRRVGELVRERDKLKRELAYYHGGMDWLAAHYPSIADDVNDACQRVALETKVETT